MDTTESVEVAAPPAAVFPHIATLDAYPAWLRLVHTVEPDAGDPLAWDVELRARVGPFARSKRLRMRRTECVDEQSVVFERAEVDGRQHAMWRLRAELEPIAEGTRLTMHLSYDGAHWTGSVLARVLDDEIRRARKALTELVGADGSSA